MTINVKNKKLTFYDDFERSKYKYLGVRLPAAR